MERETTTITTPKDSHVVVIKTYLTGREKRDITNASLPQKINYNADQNGINDLDLKDFMNRGEDAVIKTIIVSIDGKSDMDMVETVLNMRSEDSDYVIAEIKKVADGLTEEKKTQ